MTFSPINFPGWAGEEEAERVWDQIGDQFPEFRVVGDAKAGGISWLWKAVRDVLGRDLPCEAQKTGDCVSWGAKSGIEHLQAVEIFNGDREIFKPVFAPYLYYTGRVLIGKNRLTGAGSLGSWQAKAVEVYGTIPDDLEGLPDYSGDLADQWGFGRGGAEKWVDEGDNHLILTTSRIRSWPELVGAVCNGYPVTIASNLGFSMTPSSDGFHRRKGSWAHQMCIVGVCDGENPWAAIDNSWGDVHGQLIDFETGEPWPKGMLRVRPEDLEPAFKNGELFAYSQFDGFPQQELDFREVV